MSTQLVVEEVENSTLFQPSEHDLDLEPNGEEKHRKGKEKIIDSRFLQGPNKRPTVSLSPSHGCSLRLSCRGGQNS